jgi:hypothetical protein
MNADDKDWQAQLLAYRKAHFDVDITSPRQPHEEGEIVLSVTHNGNQWQSISLLPDEVKKVISALRNRP